MDFYLHLVFLLEPLWTKLQQSHEAQSLCCLKEGEEELSPGKQVATDEAWEVSQQVVLLDGVTHVGVQPRDYITYPHNTYKHRQRDTKYYVTQDGPSIRPAWKTNCSNSINRGFKQKTLNTFFLYILDI